MFCVWGIAATKIPITKERFGPNVNGKSDEKNIQKDKLEVCDDVLQSPFHIKLGRMKQFVKALNLSGIGNSVLIIVNALT
ncbi:Protein of unknown function [Gryllus bimaculatus]|nr:Protein of unknown function [Gryllus bimaculatus]